MLNRVRLLVATIAVATAAGCGAPPTAAVNGTVTDKSGKPVATGLITFMPQDGAKYREAVEAPVVDGRYELPVVSTGPKRVSVIVTRNGVSDPSLDVTAEPKEVDLEPGPQVLNVTVSKL